MTSVGDQAAGSMQEDCEGPEDAPEVLDHHYEPGMDPDLTQPEGEAPHPPQEQTPTERASNEDDTRKSEKKEQTALQLVLNELLQQQKHRPGRRFKKKTLMKMAKLLVIARGWDGEAGPPVLKQDAPVATGGNLLPDDIIESPDHSGVLDPSSAEQQKSDKDEKSETGSGGLSVPDLQVASRSAMKIEEEETGGELQTSAASCLSAEAPTALKGMTSVGDQAAGSMQEDCEGPEDAPEVLDHHYEPGMDPDLTQPEGEAPHPPQEQTPTERASNEDDTRKSEKKEQTALQLVLNELLQQQKHRPGRRFKKKTLMKMAKLLVIARGWDGEAGPPVLKQDAPVATGEDGLAETTAALNQQELYKEHLETQKEDLDLSQQASGAFRTKEDKESWFSSSRSNREEGSMTQTSEEQNPGTFRVLEAPRPRKRMKKASRTSKNKRAEPKPPEETSAEQQKRHHGAQTAVRLQSEEEVASAEQDEGLRGTVTILTLTKVRNKKQLDNVDGAEGHHGKKKKKKRRNGRVTKLAQTKPDAETFVAQRQNLQELPPGGAVLPGRTTVKSNRPKPRRRAADKAVPPPEGLLRERSPAEGSEQTRVQRTAAKMGKSKSRKRRAEPEFSGLESFPEKKQSEVWFGSVSLKQEEEEQPVEMIKKRRGRKRKEEWTEDELQSSMTAAVTVEGGQPKPAVQGERKPRERKKKIKLELPEKRSEDVSNMGAVEDTREEHLKTLKDLNSKTENCEHPASTMKKRWRKRKNSAADVTLSLPGPLFPPGDMSDALKEKTQKVPLDAAAADVPLVLCSSPLNLSLAAGSVGKTKKKRGRRPKDQAEAASQIPRTGPSLEFEDSNLNLKPPENVKKREQKSKLEKLSGQTPENTQILEFKAIKQEYDGSVTSQLLCHTEEWAPPRRKPRRRRTSGIIRTVRKVKRPHTFRNLLPVDLSESEKKTDQPSGLGEGAAPTINAAPKNHELHQTLSSEVQSHLCSVCGRSFRHLSVLTLHRSIHAESKPLTRPPRKKRSLKPPQLSCPCCAAAFNSKTQLLLHLSHAESCTAPPEEGGQHHGDIPAFVGHLPTRGRRRRHSCPTCRKTFRSPAGLSLHRKVHTRTCSSTQSFQDLDLRLLPETQSGPPETQSGPPETQSGHPVTQSGPPDTESGPPETQSGPPDTESGPPETQSGPPDTESEKPLSEPKAESVASVLFSCPTCRQLHLHWCHFVLHVRTHSTGWCLRCSVCLQQAPQDEEPPKHCSACCELSGEAETCRRMLSGSWKEAGPVRRERQHPEEEQTREGWEFSLGGGPDEGVDVQLSSPSPCSSASVEQVDVNHPALNPKSSQGARQLFFRPHAILLRRFLCARWGRCFPHWSRLRVHRGLHQKPGKAFRCSNCELDFHFLGSYLLHLQEHAAQTPHSCAACPATFAEEHQLSSRRRRCRTCSRCGKPFSSLLNLKKHELLHRGVRPYVCTRCQLPFSCSADLTAHLNVHEARLRVPEPTRLLEPLSFPYPCRKCNATFSSAELLQVHQVCHFTAARRSERPSESPASYLTRRTLEDPQRGALESPREPRPLPVSTRKHLFRYPHPDRLYVVPAPPSEPALLISDSENEVGTSAEPGSSLEKPASPSRPEISEMDQLDLLIQSLIPERDFSESESCCESKAPPLLVSPQMDDMHSCAICTAAFTELSELHAHYMEHAQIL